MSPSMIIHVYEKSSHTTYYDADEMELVNPIDGSVDWCTLTDITNDEYQTAVRSDYVKYGLIEISKPMREGRGMFVSVDHTDLFMTKALPAARQGLWWNIKTRNYDFEKTLAACRQAINCPHMSKIVRDEIDGDIAKWRVMFPDDDRIEEFYTDFVLDMITRSREIVYRDGISEVWFNRITND